MGRHRLAQGLIIFLLLVLIICSLSFIPLLDDTDAKHVQKEEYKRYAGDVLNFLSRNINKQNIERKKRLEDWEVDLEKLLDLYKNNEEPALHSEYDIELPVDSTPKKANISLAITTTTTTTTTKFPATQNLQTPLLKTSTSVPGILNVHIWEAWCGSRVEDLKRNKDFPLYPSVRSNLTRFFAQWFETGYGERIFGYIHPPETGNYTFAVSCDDNCEVWLSNNSRPQYVSKIVSVGTFKKPSNTKVADFRQHKSQISEPIYLVKGQKYYIEGLHKQAAFKDHILLTWLAPSWPRIKTISSDYISSFISDPELFQDVIEYANHIPVTDACVQNPNVYDEGSIFFFNRTTYKFGSLHHRDKFHLIGFAYDPDFDKLLPGIAYEPSYVVKFVPKRYEGINLIHESSIYPDDNTELSHMLNYERCDEHRRYDSHFNIIHNKKALLFTGRDWMHSKNFKTQYNKDFYKDKSLLKNKTMSGINTYSKVTKPAFKNPRDVRNVPDYHEIHLNTFIIPSSNLNTTKQQTTTKHEKLGSKTKEHVLETTATSTTTLSVGSIPKNRDIQKGENIKHHMLHINKEKSMNLFRNRKLFSFDTLQEDEKVQSSLGLSEMTTTEKRSSTTTTTATTTATAAAAVTSRANLISTDVKFNIKKTMKFNDKNENSKRKIYEKIIDYSNEHKEDKKHSVINNGDNNVDREQNKNTTQFPSLVPSVIKKHLDKFKLHENENQADHHPTDIGDLLRDKTDHQNPLSLYNRLIEIENKLADRNKIHNFRHKNSGLSLLPRSPIGVKDKSHYRTSFLARRLPFRSRIPMPIGKKIFFQDGEPNMKNISIHHNGQMIWLYDIFGPSIYYLTQKHKRAFAWIYKSLLSECKSDGNLQLSKEVAQSIANKFMMAIKSKHGNKYVLKKIINVEENHDVIKGNRYLLELELTIYGEDKSVRLSKYVYQELASSELYYPIDFQWNPKATVHIIVPVKDQGRWVEHFISNMERIYTETLDPHLNIIIVDYDSTDINILQRLQRSKLKRYEFIPLEGPFQRALGLQAGADTIKNEGDIIFTCDLHLEIPSQLIDSIRKHTIIRKMAFAPMVHRLSCGYTPELPYGLWEIQGYGLFSITKHDYDRIGGMNTKEFKTKWGGEDWEFLDRTLAHGLEVERIRVPHFYHYYHSKKRMWLTPVVTDVPLNI